MLTAMAAFRDGSRTATVMNRIAKGFSDDELRPIAAWFAAQK
jgi:cytochrome c553